MSLSVQTAGGKKELSLRAKIRAYQRRAAEMKEYLDRQPNEWGRFQSEFNQEINGIFRDIMIYEKENLAADREDKVYRLKRLFINRFRQEFAKGEYIVWSLKKPYGYPGDHKIIDDIYRNAPESVGFDRLFDNYFQMSTICNAVRNRKEDFKRIILYTITKSSKSDVKIMSLAAGPCRDVFEVLSNEAVKDRAVSFHCCDSDDRAIAYGRTLLRNDSRIIFTKLNAVRIALKNGVEKILGEDYDLIYSTGLFDYLDYQLSVRLIRNLRELIKKGGSLAISNVRDKFSNPSVYFMEWVGDWNLVYRKDEEFHRIFLEAGFEESHLRPAYEQQGIMQYVVAEK